MARAAPAGATSSYSSATMPRTSPIASRSTAADARAAVLERHRQRLEQLAEPLRDGRAIASTIDARWDCRCTKASFANPSTAARTSSIKDTHDHSALQRSIFSNTDWSLIRACAATLWLVKPRPPGQQPCFVAAVDPLHERDKPAELDNRILDTALELGTAFGGDVHAFPRVRRVGGACRVGGLDGDADRVADRRSRGRYARRRTTMPSRACAARTAFPPERTHVQQGGTRELLDGA